MMQEIKRIIKIVFAVMAFMLIIIGVYFLRQGSFEMYPTDEQVGKNVIASVVLIILGIVFGLSSLLLRGKK